MTSTDSVLSLGIDQFIRTDVEHVKMTDNLDAIGQAYKRSSLPVIFAVDDAGILKGVITDNDLTDLIRFKPDQTVANFISEKTSIAIKKDAELWQLIKIMNGANALGQSVDKLAVIDEGQHPVGVILRNDLKTSLG